MGRLRVVGSEFQLTQYIAHSSILDNHTRGITDVSTVGRRMRGTREYDVKFSCAGKINGGYSTVLPQFVLGFGESSMITAS